MERKSKEQFIASNMMAHVIGYPVSAAKKTFTSYFQYKIGVYQRDYYLYFTSMPNSMRYTNDIFNKLNEFDGYEIIQFVDFHYAAYDYKADFLRFLTYETNQRLKLKLSRSFIIKLESVLDWLSEKQEEQYFLQEQEVKASLEPEVYNILEKEVGKSSSAPEKLDTENITKEIVDTLSPYLEALMSITEEKMKAVTDAYATGHIQLNNHSHLEKIVQLFYLVQNITAPKELVKGEMLFKQFSAIDIASILHLHFEAFKAKKINTIQGNIKSATDNLNYKNPKVEKLNKALEEFFYS